jgi:hypothetical protein
MLNINRRKSENNYSNDAEVLFVWMFESEITVLFRGKLLRTTLFRGNFFGPDNNTADNH